MWEKYELNGKTLSNLYKIKWVEKELKYKADEGSITVKQWGDKETTVKQWADKETKRKGKSCWKKCNSKYVN